MTRAATRTLLALAQRVYEETHPHYTPRPDGPPRSPEESALSYGWRCLACGQGAAEGGPMVAIPHDPGCWWTTARDAIQAFDGPAGPGSDRNTPYAIAAGELFTAASTLAGAPYAPHALRNVERAVARCRQLRDDEAPGEHGKTTARCFDGAAP